MAQEQVGPKAVLVWFLSRPLSVLVVLILLLTVGLLELYSIGFYTYEKLTPTVTGTGKFYSDTDDLYHPDSTGTIVNGKLQTAKHIDLRPPIEAGAGQHRNVIGPCIMNPANPYDPGIAPYMISLRDLVCTAPGRELRISLNSSNLFIAGKGIVSGICRSIISELDGSISMSKPKVFLDTIYSLQLKVGESGAIQNVASKRCIKPAVNSLDDAPSQIELRFDDDCTSKMSQFAYEKGGVLRHVLSNKCVMPKDNSERPPNDTPLVLGDSCTHHFVPYGINGLLQHEQGKSCIHNLGGGSEPEQGQRLCVWESCEDQPRLLYRWFPKSEGIPTISQAIPLADTCDGTMEVEVKFAEGESVFEYVPKAHPVSLPMVSVDMRTPNIFVIALDEASAAHMKRKLLKSLEYMTKEMQIMEIRKFSAVSSSTEENLMAYIADEKQPNLFELARRAGYASLLSVDKPVLFRRMPEGAMHSSWPLFTLIGKYHGLCRATQTVFGLSFRYLQSLIEAYPKHPKLAVLLLSHITSGNFNNLGYMDSALETLMIDLHKMENTILVFTSMRGTLSGKLGQVPQGLIEYRQPYLGIYVSQDIRAFYPSLSKEMQFLVTPFNVYASIAKILDKTFVSEGYKRAFGELTVERSCVEAGVSSQMCPCT